MKKIKLDFVDFWPDWNKTNNFFYNLLKEDYEIEICDDPDYLIYSVFGGSHINYKCTKIFFTGENLGVNFSECDYAFSFDWLDNPNNYRLPLYVLYENSYKNILNPKIIEPGLADRKFCNYVISNAHGKLRNDFIDKLAKYKPIDSGGGYNNNVGGRVVDKIAFQNQYKFSITYENSAYRGEYPGYTTEKIMEAMDAMSIPIYRGNPVVNKDFNTKSFVNYYDCGSEEEMIEYIIYLDNNDDEYLKMLSQPWHVNNVLPANNRKETIKLFLNKIFN